MADPVLIWIRLNIVSWPCEPIRGTMRMIAFSLGLKISNRGVLA